MTEIIGDLSEYKSITLKERVIGVLKYHSIEKEEDWSHIIEERDFEELADNLISCFKQFSNFNTLDNVSIGTNPLFNCSNIKLLIKIMLFFEKKIPCIFSINL